MASDSAKRARTQEEEHDIDTGETYAWKLCAGQDSNILRIPSKEFAVERAEHHVTQLCDLLRKYAQNDDSEGAKSLQRWINLADATIEKHHNFEVLVGVSGVTGAGKTSLLNALLGFKELLPSSQEQAATAVSCKVSWNFDTTPGQEHRAEILFQSYDEIKQQIIRTLEAFKLYDAVKKATYSNEADQVNDIAEAAAAKKEGMDKIYAVWRASETDIKTAALGCKKPKDLDTTAAQIMSTNQAVIQFLQDESMTISSSHEEVLGTRIKPFLDSTAANHGHSADFAVWPLIKDVRVYLRSELLRSGICLVDLPGVGDNVESRARVAEEYRRRLEVTMIVAAMIRAADEKCTQKLLSTSQEMRMELGNGCNPHAFGVILSKMDDLDTTPYVTSKQAEHDPGLTEHQTIIATSRNELKTVQREKAALENSMKKLKARAKKLANAKTAGTAADKQAQLSAARTEINMSQDRIDALDKQIVVLESRIKLGKVHVDHWALVKRNAMVHARFLDDFKRRQAQLYEEAGIEEGENGEVVLDVYSSSSRAFWALREEDKTLTAFPADKYTGVPAVVKWIHLATATRREQHLDTILAELRDALNAIEKWCKTEKIDLPVEVDVKALRITMAGEYKNFEEELSGNLMKFYNQFEKLDPFSKKSAAKIKKDFKADAGKVAARWAMKYPHDETASSKMAWNTYLAIANRMGGPYVSPSNPALEYDWIPKLAEPLVLRLKTEWTQFNARLPSLWDEHQAAVQQTFKAHFVSMVTLLEGFEPTLKTYLCHTEGDIVGVHETVNNELKNMIGVFQRGINVYEAASDSMRASLKTPFESCKDIKGPSCYVKRRELLMNTVGRNAPKYFDQAWTAMKAEVASGKTSLYEKLGLLIRDSVQRVRSPIEISIDNHFGDIENPKKLDAQSQVQDILAAWRDDWQFPHPDGTHVLERDESIPNELDPKDLAPYLGKEDSDAGSDLSDDEDAAKENNNAEKAASQVKTETNE